MSGDIHRALAAPRKLLPPDRAHIERLVGWSGDLDYRLSDDQVACLHEAYQTRGLVASMGVGLGKSLITLLLAAVLGCSFPIIFVKKNLVDNLERERRKFSPHYRIVTYRVMTYDQLSVQTNALVLDQTRVDLVISDEAHLLKNMLSARFHRIASRVINEPAIVFCALTGTLTTVSCADYAHIAELALRDGSPIPQYDSAACVAWKRMFGAISDPEKVDFQYCHPLVKQYPNDKATFADQGREALRQHLTTTAGFVMTQEISCRSSLVMTRITQPSLPPHVRGLIDQVDVELLDPEGNGISVHEADLLIRQLQYGFWYKKNWGDTPPDIIEEWQMATRAWNSAVRRYLQEGAALGVDSPGLVRKATAEGKLGDYATSLLERLEAVEDLAAYTLDAIWVWDGWFQDQVRWLETRKEAALLWYRHRAIGQRLAAETRFPVYAENARINVDEPHKCALSINSMREGHNLQAWRLQRVSQVPLDAGVWQQMLARTHRRGQQFDEVFAEVVTHTKMLQSTLERAKLGAGYIEKTTGERQRLSFATWASDDVSLESEG